MAPIHTLSEYQHRIEQIRLLKYQMWALAQHKGNLDPDVIRISQDIDEYIVSVQQYWIKNPCASTQTG